MMVPRTPSPLCPACSAPAAWRLLCALTSSLSVHRCGACDAALLFPRPTEAELLKHYDRYYLTKAEDQSRQERLVQMHEPIVDFLTGQLRGPRPFAVLDFGFGNGAFLLCVARRGHLAFGADISSQNVEQLTSAAARAGVPIQAVNLASETIWALERHTFDLVTLFQVIEHVVHPLHLLRGLAAMQRPGDFLYLECPNNDAWVARVKVPVQRWYRGAGMWRTLKWPEHLNGFTLGSITRLLDRAGYDVVRGGDYAYRDGVHQVEAEVWWPPLRLNPNRYTPYGLSRSAIPGIDRLAWRWGSGGSGLWVLGRKRHPLANRWAALRAVDRPATGPGDHLRREDAPDPWLARG